MTNHYQNSGVDIEKADSLVGWLKEDKSKETPLGSPVSAIGGFAALFRPNFGSMEKPLLVSSTDGVGTKLLLGLNQNNLRGLGQDLVAMCINDLYTIGARPLFFLDYFATGKLDENQFKEVLGGIKEACTACETALIGGETAELPGLYDGNHFDLAGFVVGVVDEPKMLGAHKVKPKDTVIAISSSGFHSNGYSLIRKWFDKMPVDNQKAYAEKLLLPTMLYTLVPDLADEFGESVRAASHITGGGISGNLCRVIPENLQAKIDFADLPKIDWMMEFIEKNVDSPMEVENAFNLGTGMMLVVDTDSVTKISEKIKDLGFNSAVVGSICERESNTNAVEFI